VSEKTRERRDLKRSTLREDRNWLTRREDRLDLIAKHFIGEVSDDRHNGNRPASRP
jgi:hypothetical protein